MPYSRIPTPERDRGRTGRTNRWRGMRKKEKKKKREADERKRLPFPSPDEKQRGCGEREITERMEERNKGGM